MLIPTLCSCAQTTTTTTTNNNSGVETNELGEEIPPVPTTKYDGADFIIYMTNRNNDTNIVRDFEMTEAGAQENVLNENIYKRNVQIEGEFDIKFDTISEYSSTNTGTQKIRQANMSNTHTYDMCVIGTYSVSNLAKSGDLQDLNDYGSIDLRKSWWDQNANRDLAVNGKLFFTTGDISLSVTQAMYGLMFNKEMFDDQGWEYPYQLVRDGKWTFDEMVSLSKKVSDDLDGDQDMDAYDQYGFGWINSTCVAFLNASGERVARVNSQGKITLTVTTERAADAVVSYIEFINMKEYAFNGQKGTSGLADKTAIGMFADGQMLFRAGEHLCFPHLRDTTLNYGILPLPKLDETQANYYTPVGSWDSAYVCVPNSTQDTDKTSAIIERMAYVSSITVTPAYYERTLEGKYMRDEESYDMITIEIKNRMYDIGLIYDFGTISTEITNLSLDGLTQFSSMLKGVEDKARNEINTTNSDFEKQSNN